MSEIRQGQVYWLDFGRSSGSAPADRHPCVVVQNDVFNRSAIATTVVCLITSNLNRAKAPGNVLLKSAKAAAGGARRKRNSKDLAAGGESVLREFLNSAKAAPARPQVTRNTRVTESRSESVLREFLINRGEANLEKASVVNVSQALTVDKSELVDCLGTLGQPARAAVRDGLHLLFDRL